MIRWHQTLDLSDVFHADIPFPEKRDEMVRRVRKLNPLDAELQDIADELETTQDVDQWDNPWDDFYDWADRCNVWVETIVPRVSR